MSEIIEKLGMGWLPDYPDFRDYSPEHDSIKSLLKKTKMAKTLKEIPLTATTDLRPLFSPIENQGNLGSCTAHAGVGLVEYFEKRTFGKYLDASRLFLYKVTRNLLHWTGDTGAYMRTTMKAMVLFGVPPEEYLPYIISQFDVEPSAFCYAFAQSYQSILYYRLDPIGTSGTQLLSNIKSYLNVGFPSMFGFTVYSSYNQGVSTGKIPYPSATNDPAIGGHAIIAAGYDDSMVIQNTRPGEAPTTGAILIRNSWGPGWGQGGYGYLPYKYFTNGLARDCWTLISNEWVDTGVFS